jgi:simple sugar transport system ATP-binding protein
MVMQDKAVEAAADERVKQFDVRTPSTQTSAGSLSGGNQQKVIVAREFSRPIKLLVASQPTRGLDVGSIEYIHSRIVQKRNDGVAVLLVSPELDEVMALSDRIAVMYRGRIVAVVDADVATKEYLGLLMAGVDPATLPPPEKHERHKVEAVF